MIISQTPYRVSFAGGGTDLPAFYRQEHGAVLSTTIDQHMYVTIHRRFEPTIRDKLFPHRDGQHARRGPARAGP